MVHLYGRSTLQVHRNKSIRPSAVALWDRFVAIAFCASFLLLARAFLGFGSATSFSLHKTVYSKAAIKLAESMELGGRWFESGRSESGSMRTKPGAESHSLPAGSDNTPEAWYDLGKRVTPEEAVRAHTPAVTPTSLWDRDDPFEDDLLLGAGAFDVNGQPFALKIHLRDSNGKIIPERGRRVGPRRCQGSDGVPCW